MSAVVEGGVIALLKWVAGFVIAGVGGFFWRRQDRLEKKFEDVYTKKETQEQIELRMQPFKDAVNGNTKAMEKLTDVLTEVRVDFAEVKSDVKSIKQEQSSGTKGKS
jgi:sugar-specific transcriptional regulator TrmB